MSERDSQPTFPASNQQLRRFILVRDETRPHGVTFEHSPTGNWVPFDDAEALARRLSLREEQIDGYERQLGIINESASRTIGSEIERLMAVVGSLQSECERLMQELERRPAGETTCRVCGTPKAKHLSGPYCLKCWRERGSAETTPAEPLPCGHSNRSLCAADCADLAKQRRTEPNRRTEETSRDAYHCDCGKPKMVAEKVCPSCAGTVTRK